MKDKGKENLSETGPLLSIVIPLYREGAHFGTSFSEIRRCAESSLLLCEYILVDDGSDDNTWEVIEEICGKDSAVTGLRFSRNFGKEAAIYAGLERTSGSAVIVMDGDLQHPPEMIPEMVRIWQGGKAQVVNTVRSGRGSRFLGYKLAARLHGKILNILSGFDLEGSSDFKLMDRAVVDSYLRLGESRIFYRGLVAWMGFRQVNLPMEFVEGRKAGSSWSLPRLVRLALNSFTSFSTLALHLVTFLGLLLFCFSILLSVNTLLQWMQGSAVPGFTTVILLQLIFSSIIMIALGIIGEYIATIFHEIKNRPRYILMKEFARPDRSPDGE